MAKCLNVNSERKMLRTLLEGPQQKVKVCATSKRKDLKLPSFYLFKFSLRKVQKVKDS